MFKPFKQLSVEDATRKCSFYGDGLAIVDTAEKRQNLMDFLASVYISKHVFCYMVSTSNKCLTLSLLIRFWKRLGRRFWHRQGSGTVLLERRDEGGWLSVGSRWPKWFSSRSGHLRQFWSFNWRSVWLEVLR